MPRIKPLTTDNLMEYEWKKLTDNVIKDIAVSNIKKQDIAKICGITPGALSQQFSNKRITIQTYLAWQILKSEKGEGI